MLFVEKYFAFLFQSLFSFTFSWQVRWKLNHFSEVLTFRRFDVLTFRRFDVLSFRRFDVLSFRSFVVWHSGDSSFDVSTFCRSGDSTFCLFVVWHSEDSTFDVSSFRRLTFWRFDDWHVINDVLGPLQQLCSSGLFFSLMNILRYFLTVFRSWNFCNNDFPFSFIYNSIFVSLALMYLRETVISYLNLSVFWFWLGVRPLLPSPRKFVHEQVSTPFRHSQICLLPKVMDSVNYTRHLTLKFKQVLFNKSKKGT